MEMFKNFFDYSFSQEKEFKLNILQVKIKYI